MDMIPIYGCIGYITLSMIKYEPNIVLNTLYSFFSSSLSGGRIVVFGSKVERK